MTASDIRDFQPPYQVAGEQLYQAIVNLRPPFFPVEDSEQLTVLLIQWLAQSLRAEVLGEFWHHCQSWGEAVDSSATDFWGLSPTLELPSPLPPPQFNLGTHLRWKPLPEDTEDTDRGIVIGSFYAPSQRGWQWKYLILLDSAAYSRQFCVADTAWEEDLECVREGNVSEYSP